MVRDKRDARHPGLESEAIDSALHREPSQAIALMAQLIVLADTRTQALEAEVDRLHTALRGDKQELRRDAQVSAALKQVRKRMRRLEAELRELREQQKRERISELQRLRQEIAALRKENETGFVAKPAHLAIISPSLSTLPSYLLSGYAEITSLLAGARESEQLNKRAEVAETRFRAADRACNLLGKLCDDEGYYAQLQAVTHHAELYSDEVPNLITNDDRFDEVRTPLLQLLVLGGISTIDAARLIDECRADYLERPDVWRHPAVTRRNFRRLRNAVCGEVKKALKQDVKRAQMRDQAVPVLLKGVGGGALGALAGPMGSLVGASAAAAVAAMGTAAVDAGADLLGK